MMNEVHIYIPQGSLYYTQDGATVKALIEKRRKDEKVVVSQKL